MAMAPFPMDICEYVERRSEPRIRESLSSMFRRHQLSRPKKIGRNSTQNTSQQKNRKVIVVLHGINNDFKTQ
jgi:hypothetical protein